MEDSAELDVTFIGAPGAQLEALAISNGKIVASGQLRQVLLETTGIAEAAVDECDAFVLVGLQFTVNRCAQLFATHRTWRADDPEVADANGWFFASRPFLLAATEERLRQSAAMSLVDRLRALTAAPILLVPQPNLSERVLELDSKSREVWRELHAHGRGKEVRSIYEDACRALSGDFEIVRQPSETIVHDIFTLDRYDCANPSKRPITNFHISHANVEYGRLVVRDLLDRLGS